MTIGEIINAYRQQPVVPLMDRVDLLRSQLLTRKANKHQRISNACYQTITVDVEKLLAPIIYYKSLRRLPIILTNIHNSMFWSVTNSDASLTYSYVADFTSMRYARVGRYTRNISLYTIDDGFLYLYGNKVSKSIVVKGVFSDVRIAMQYNNPGIDLRSMEYPMDSNDLLVLLSMLEPPDDGKQLRREAPENQGGDPQQAEQE